MRSLIGLLAGCAVWAAGAEPGVLDPAMARLLRASGAESYALKADYGAGIDALCLGFDKTGAVVVGVASRETKTYRKSMAIVAVTPAAGKYRISAAEIPDIGQFHGKSQDLARAALKEIAGQELADAAAARGLVDGVTGATQYRKAIYVSYSHMAAKVIAEIQNTPPWPRKPLPPG